MDRSVTPKMLYGPKRINYIINTNVIIQKKTPKKNQSTKTIQCNYTINIFVLIFRKYCDSFPNPINYTVPVLNKKALSERKQESDWYCRKER